MEHKELQIGSDLDAESEQVEIIGIHTLCRLCATQNDRLMGIYSEEGITNDLSNKINLYLPVKVAETDDLPLQCCWNCATTLLAWHELVVTSVEIDRKFRNSQFIADKQTTETEGFDHPETGISDDNDGCDDEGLAAAEGNIVALFNHIKKEPTDPQPKQLMAPNQCEICEKLLSCRSNYLSHVKTHVSDNYCRLCCNSYNTKFKLNSHSTSHKDGKDAPQTFVQCDFEDCLLQFPSKLQLHHHKNTHFNVTTFQCEICGRQFWKKSALESHGLKHEKKISCKVCGKVLSSKKTLRDHRRLHTGEKPYKCRHCDEVFRCQSGLKYHEVIHSGVKKYRCQLCGMNFLRSNYLKGHLRIHAKEKPYQCQHCNEKFGQMGVLKRHEARMHIKCGLCEAVVGRRGNLKEHMWKVHDAK